MRDLASELGDPAGRVCRIGRTLEHADADAAADDIGVLLGKGVTTLDANNHQTTLVTLAVQFTVQEKSSCTVHVVWYRARERSIRPNDNAYG